MHLTYLVITVLAAIANGCAAALSLAGADYVKLVADRVHVSHGWMAPFGVLLGTGATGLVVGLAVPVLGAAAAAGLVLYFLGALGAHLRVRDRGVGGAVAFLGLAAIALLANLGYHGVL